MASKYVTETKAAKSVSAYIVTNKKGEFVAKIQAHFADGGRCLVNVFDAEEGFQSASASGYGYDKFTSALSGLKIGGHVMSNHCGNEGAPKPPKGRTTFPTDYKVKKGYTLANWARVSKETGRKIYADEWRAKAKLELGEKADFDKITERAIALERAWEKSEDFEAGYMSCFRLDGLKYLEALGFKVFRAI